MRKILALAFSLNLLVSTACTKDLDAQTNSDRYLTGNITKGNWLERKQKNNKILMFGVPNSEPRLSFFCNAASHQIVVEKAQYLPNQKFVMVSIVTATSNSTYQAEISNQGLPKITFALKLNDPILQKLAATQDRFAVVPQTGKSLLLPTTPKIQNLVKTCR